MNRHNKSSVAAMKQIPSDGFKHPWPLLIKMDAAVKAKVERLFGNGSDNLSVRT
jgi:hypothetical protein